ncbi:hypothetical protein LWI29_017182 [Acer saccharum]|uniref:TF-B3 domain-containing protein n=1 Tax=Acer saccharum TaxID=4024 RepID=A0AA39W1V2_ACESA|nr:hypothetical protein LWI29_017182 [Acer saccharum]
MWTLRYYTLPAGNRASPVITVGWLEFVRAKRVEVGDELTFYGHQDRAADGELQMQYMIQVTRTSNVTGDGGKQRQAAVTESDQTIESTIGTAATESDRTTEEQRRPDDRKVTEVRN